MLPTLPQLSSEVQYMLLVVGLFIVPRALQRFGIPSAITSVALGALCGIGLHAFHDDETIRLLAAFGIVAMFLFAGLEVDFKELKQGRKVLLQHIAIQLLILVLGSVVVAWGLDLSPRASLLFSLALFTPSTGFILDTLRQLNLTLEERFWVKSKAIASELIALGVLFVTIQSTDPGRLGISALTLGVMVMGLPIVFRVFSKVIAPFAPGTEFTFLIIVALLCAYVTRELGVYYLVGAFVVGLTAVRLRREVPALTSEKLLGAVELFASFFIPFYFLKAGLHLRAEHFSPGAFGVAAVLLLLVVPVRIFRVAIHRRIVLAESWGVGIRIGTAVLPTLVFTIVIGEILVERFDLSDRDFGALLLFTLVNTIVPGYALKVPAPEFDTPEAPRIDPPPHHA